MGTKKIKMDIQTALKGECPVCFQIPRGKIFNICANGHYLCETCSAQVTSCPECRSSGVRSRNILAERFLDDNEFPCCWSGCGETMNRSELSSHEYLCQQNPDTVQFCSKLFPWKKCEYKFASNWLSEPDNCTEFLNHVNACMGDCLQEIVQDGEIHNLIIKSTDILSEKRDPARRVNVPYLPTFDRFDVPNQNKVELFFLATLVKVDQSENKFVSFAYVQLTPDILPKLVKFTIDGNKTSGLVSQWEENSSPSINWTQKAIDFNQFMEMVETSQSNSETEMQRPFSMPFSFLSDNFLDQDQILSVDYVVEQTS